LRIERLEAAVRIPEGEDLNGRASYMQCQIKDLAAEIGWLELADRHIASTDVQIREMAKMLWDEVVARDPIGDLSVPQEERFSQLRNGLVLRFNRARVALWDASAYDPGLETDRMALLVKIDDAIANPLDMGRFHDAFEAGVALDRAYYAWIADATGDRRAQTNVANLEANCLANGYSTRDALASLLRYAGANGELFPWREIDGQFCHSPFDELLFSTKIPNGSPLPRVNRGPDAPLAHWTDSSPSALVRYVNYAVNTILAPGNYGGIHELELTEEVSGRPVVHVPDDSPTGWVLAVRATGGKRYVLPGVHGWEPAERNPSADSPVYDPDSIRDFQELWDFLTPRDGDGNPIPYPDLSPVVGANGVPLSYGALDGHAAATGTRVEFILQEVQNKLQDAYEQLLLCCWLYNDAVLGYNIGQGHWQQLVPVRHRGEAVRCDGRAIF
jgi:hypothetical protein